MIALVILATIASTFLGGLFAIRFKDKLHLVLGFSAGAVLGVTLFDLIPESIGLSAASYNIETIMIMAAFGFSFYLVLDRFFSIHCEDPHDCENNSHRLDFGPAALTFHSALDGLGIGLAFKISPSVGWVVAIAVLAHKFSDGINIVGFALRSKSSYKIWLTANAVAPVIGFFVSFFINIPSTILGLILAFFIGLFLYISASDLIPESHHHHPTAATTVATLVGISAMYFIIRLLG